MKIVLAFAIAVTLAGLTHSATAAEWINLLKAPEPPDGLMIAVDKDSMRDLGNGRVAFWSREGTEKPERVIGGPNAGAEFSFAYYDSQADCRQRKYLVSNVMLRDRAMKLVLADQIKDRGWEVVPPDTWREHIFKVVCSRYYPPQ